jgi:hypothetical protein
MVMNYIYIHYGNEDCHKHDSTPLSLIKRHYIKPHYPLLKPNKVKRYPFRSIPFHTTHMTLSIGEFRNFRSPCFAPLLRQRPFWQPSPMEHADIMGMYTPEVLSWEVWTSISYKHNHNMLIYNIYICVNIYIHVITCGHMCHSQNMILGLWSSIWYWGHCNGCMNLY